jgi:apolipoprotein N-acyltransferase
VTRRRRAAGAAPAARLAQAAVGGLALAAAFPPHDLWWLAPVAVVLHARAVRGLGWRATLLPTLALELGFFLPLLIWLRPVGTDAWLVLALMQSVVALPLGPLVARAQRLTPTRAVLGTIGSWVAVEAWRARVPFGGFPWGKLAFSQVDGPLLPLARIGGAALVSAAVVGVGALLVHLSVRRAGLILAVLAVALNLPLPDGAGARSIQVAAVQGNVPRLGLDFAAQRRAVLDNHVNATIDFAADVRAGRRAAPDLVLWPENSSDLDPFTEPDAAAQLTRAAQAIGQPILVGAVLQGPGRYVSNAGLVWTPAGPDGQRYIKQHPVPFGEYLPLRSVLATLITRFNRIGSDFVHGRHPGRLVVNGIPLADVICFEIADDGVVRRSVGRDQQLLVVQTNNATFAGAESQQQLAMVRLRAVEVGRSAAMVSTSGISALVAPSGVVLTRSGLFRRQVLEHAVPLLRGRTTAVRWGRWIELGLVLLVLITIVPGHRRSPWAH